MVTTAIYYLEQKTFETILHHFRDLITFFESSGGNGGLVADQNGTVSSSVTSMNPSGSKGFCSFFGRTQAF